MLLWRGRLRGVRRLLEMHCCRTVLIDSLADAAADFSSATSVLCRAGWYGASLRFVSKLSVLVYFEMYFSQSITKIHKLTILCTKIGMCRSTCFQNQVHLTENICFFGCVCIGNIFVCLETEQCGPVYIFIYLFIIKFVQLFFYFRHLLTL